VFQLLMKMIVGEETDDDLQESAVETLVALSEKDDLKPHILALVLDKSLIGISKLSSPDPEHKKIYQRYVLKIIANLSLDDSTVDRFFEHFDFVLDLSLTEDVDLTLSGLMILGNLARSDDQCQKMVKRNELIPFLLKNLSHKDMRVVHLSLGTLHNLSISVPNKTKLLEAGILPLLIELLKNKENPNLLIQYSIVGTLKNLVILGDSVRIPFIEQGGLGLLVQLANGEFKPVEHKDEESEGEEKKEPDKRVQYEAARVLIRFIDAEENAITVVKLGGVPPILDLIRSKFAILQAEGAKAILRFSQIAELKPTLLETETLVVLENLKNDTPEVQEDIQKIRSALQ